MWLPQMVFHKATKSPDNTVVAPRRCNNWVTIPYFEGVSDRIKNIFRAFGVSTVFKPVNTLREKLVNVKDRTPKEKMYNLVYRIKCAHPGCDESYIGETKQALKQQLNK